MYRVTRTNIVSLAVLLFGVALGVTTAESPKATPLVVGETFSIDSKKLNEKRRINV